jgi:hypothetical protein
MNDARIRACRLRALPTGVGRLGAEPGRRAGAQSEGAELGRRAGAQSESERAQRATWRWERLGAGKLDEGEWEHF